MTAGSLTRIGDPRYQAPEQVTTGNDPRMPTPSKENITWLNLRNREYSEFAIKCEDDFKIAVLNSNIGARFRLFIMPGTLGGEKENINVSFSQWNSDSLQIPLGTFGNIPTYSFILEVEVVKLNDLGSFCYKITNLIRDNEVLPYYAWSGAKTKRELDRINEGITTNLWQNYVRKSPQGNIPISGDQRLICLNSQSSSPYLTIESEHTTKNIDSRDQYGRFKFMASMKHPGTGSVSYKTILQSDGIGNFFIAKTLTAQNLKIGLEDVATKPWTTTNFLSASGTAANSTRLGGNDHSFFPLKTKNEQIGGSWNFNQTVTTNKSFNILQESGTMQGRNDLGIHFLVNRMYSDETYFRTIFRHIKHGGTIAVPTEPIPGARIFSQDFETSDGKTTNFLASITCNMEGEYKDKKWEWALRNGSWKSTDKIMSFSGTRGTFHKQITCKGNVSVEGTLTESSDARLKSNIQKISNALKMVNQISGYTYSKQDHRSAGVIAQELKEIFPVAVCGQETTSEYLRVNYNSLSALFIQAIKELDTKINNLSKTL